MNVAYLRCSTNEQDTTHQLQTIQTYCRTNGLTIDKTISEEGVSAYSTSYKDRKINSVLESTEKIDNLIIFEASRLSRNMVEGQDIIQKFTLKGTKIHSVKDNSIINQNSLDQLLNAFRYFQASEESKNTSARIKSAKQLQRERHEYLGGRIPIGYEVEGKRLKIQPSTKCTIMQLFNIYLSSGCNMCIKYLKEHGINKDSNEEVLHILKNRIYIGYPYTNSDIYIPELQIIDNDTFNQVQEKIKSRGFSKRNNRIITAKSNSVLEGLVYSPCRKMNIDYNRGVKIFRSRCKCKDHQKTFIYEKIEAQILNKLFSTLNTIDYELLEQKIQEKKDKEYRERKNKLNNTKSELKQKESILVQFNKKLEQLIMMDNIDSNAINLISNKISTIEQEINTLYDTIYAVDNSLTHSSNIISLSKYKDFESIYNKGDILHKKLLVQQIVNKIVVHSYDDIDIHIKSIF